MPATLVGIVTLHESINVLPWRAVVTPDNSQFAISTFQFSICIAFFSSPLECLRKPELYLSLMQSVNRRRRGRVEVLRNQKLRRIQQISVIHCQRTAERRFESEAKSDRVTPPHPQILRIQIGNKVTRRRDRLRMENIAHAAKHVAAVVERHDLNVRRNGHARFQIHHDHSVATDRHREWIHADDVSVWFAKYSDRNDDLTRPCFFVSKAAQRRRTA